MMNAELAASRTKATDPASSAVASRDPGLEQVCRAIKGLRFGEVRVIVQDGVIVQIERLEKQRLR